MCMQAIGVVARAFGLLHTLLMATSLTGGLFCWVSQHCAAPRHRDELEALDFKAAFES